MLQSVSDNGLIAWFNVRRDSIRSVRDWGEREVGTYE